MCSISQARARLKSALAALVREPDRVEFIIAISSEEQNHYVQFAPSSITPGNLYAEAVSNAYLEIPAGQRPFGDISPRPLTAEREATLKSLGWNEPRDQRHDNWSREFYLEAGDGLDPIVDLAITTLVRVYEATAVMITSPLDPAELNALMASSSP
jgi:hypothetical protein